MKPSQRKAFASEQAPRHRPRDLQTVRGRAVRRAGQPDDASRAADLRRRAEERLLKQHAKRKSEVSDSETDPRRLLQELQVHQIELEVQNMALEAARDAADVLLEKYTDLYDFAPVGYFSLDEQGRILEVNLTGAALLGVDRPRLINMLLPRFVVSASQPVLQAFLERVFAGTGKQVCEVALMKVDASAFWASMHGALAISSFSKKWCRVAISDITSLKQAEEAQRRAEALAAANRELRSEIVRRESVEAALKKSEQNSRRLLKQSRLMQEQLRRLSRQILSAQEDERTRISRELHDVIGQTLTGIIIRLANVKRDADDARSLDRNIARTQKLVEHSVNVVHRFARELRPTTLDDLGLIPALHTFIKTFTKLTGIQVSLSASPAVEQVNGDKRTALYRVAHEALNNAARHAKASRVEIEIQKRDNAIYLGIKDNGKGFLAKRKQHAKADKRLGLLGMKERLEMVGGSFNITSAPGKGTAILAQIPLTDGRVGAETPTKSGGKNLPT